MPANRRRKIEAYKAYFQKKYKDDVEKALANSKNLEEADNKLDSIIARYDAAWDQVCYFYNATSEEEDS